ncbi:MAG: DUF3078 domain-containing protein [Bacteroidaceae bacterium]
MRKIGLFILGTLFTMSLFAQANKENTEQQKGQTEEKTPNWKKGGMFSLTFSQTSLSNWSAGGDDAISSNALIDVYANYSKDKNSWENKLKMEYGLMRQDGQSVRKSIDNLEFASKYGYKASKNWYYSALLGFQSQFAKGYDYSDTEGVDDTKLSNFLAPAYLTLSLGMDYKPNDMFSAYLSPLTGKITIVADEDLSDAGAFGVNPGDTFRSEFGTYTKFACKKDIMKNVNLQSTLALFSAYKTFGNVDVNWDISINMKVNELLTATVHTALVYDDDVLTKVQFKEVIAVGLAYRF